VHLALGECDALPETYDVVEDHYMVRDLDTPPGVFPAEAFFDGILDARERKRTSRSSAVHSRGGDATWDVSNR